MAVPKTITITVPNPRDPGQFDHYLFSFAHRGGGNTYCAAAIPKGENPRDAADDWALDNFPHSAVAEGRHRFKRILLPSLSVAERDVKNARAVYEPTMARWQEEHKKSLGLPRLTASTKKQWHLAFLWRRRYDKAKDRLERAEAMLHPRRA